MLFHTACRTCDVRLKKRKDISDLCLSSLVKSRVRVDFHDRRLQYDAAQHFETWIENRPGERVINIDVPLSENVLQPHEPPESVNQVEFTWDTEKSTGASVFIQVHCISTEFTARKHGGEKGVPFRIQVDTFENASGGGAGTTQQQQRIHSASCQVKVFKPKGADRKQKTDKDKMEKRGEHERQKYQQSFGVTQLTDCYMSSSEHGEDVATTSSHHQQQQHRLVQAGNSGAIVYTTVTQPYLQQQQQTLPYDQLIISNHTTNNNNNPITTAPYEQLVSIGAYSQQQQQNVTQMYLQKPPTTPTTATTTAPATPRPSYKYAAMEQLVPASTVAETQHWLSHRRFADVAGKFLYNFSGADLLTLTRDDLIEICDQPAEGIRLFNALHCKRIQPRLTVLLTRAAASSSAGGGGSSDDITVYTAHYLDKATLDDLKRAVAESLFEDDGADLGVGAISRLLYQPYKQPGKNLKHVLVTDKIVQNMENQTSFSCTLLKNETAANSNMVILKQT